MVIRLKIFRVFMVFKVLKVLKVKVKVNVKVDIMPYGRLTISRDSHARS